MGRMVVIVVVPVAIRVPAMGVFVPPAMAVIPAELTRCLKFVTPMVSLLAVPAVVFDGLVEFMVGMHGAFLAFIFAGGRARRTNKRE